MRRTAWMAVKSTAMTLNRLWNLYDARMGFPVVPTDDIHQKRQRAYQF
jgi:hypothetical protein